MIDISRFFCANLLVEFACYSRKEDKREKKSRHGGVMFRKIKVDAIRLGDNCTRVCW